MRMRLLEWHNCNQPLQTFWKDLQKTLGTMFGGGDKEVKEQNAKIEALKYLPML